MFPRFSDLVNWLLGTNLSFPGYTYGFFYVAGFVAAGIITFLELKRKARAGLIPPSSETLTLYILAVTITFTLIGAKLFHIFEHPGLLAGDPVKILFSLDGFSFYGGFVFASVAVGIFAHTRKISVANIGDVTAPAILISYAIGRLGCQLSGDGCWGIPNSSPKPGWMGFFPDWAWSYRFPHNVINSGILVPECEGSYCHILAVPVYPTSLYECLITLCIFCFLWVLRKKMNTPGYIFASFLILNGISRLLIERIRINPRFHICGMNLTQAEIIAFFLVLLGISGLWYFRRSRDKIAP